MKVAINRCYGGFGLSPKATLWLWERGFEGIATDAIEYHGGPGGKYYELHKTKGDSHWRKSLAENLAKWRAYQNGQKVFCPTIFTPDEKFCLYAGHLSDKRNHPLLIQCLEELGESAWGEHAEIVIVDVPDDINFEIDEYDGLERVAESHRTWE